MSGYTIVLEWFNTATETDHIKREHSNKPIVATLQRARNMLRAKDKETDCVAECVRIEDSHTEETIAFFIPKKR